MALGIVSPALWISGFLNLPLAIGVMAGIAVLAYIAVKVMPDHRAPDAPTDYPYPDPAKVRALIAELSEEQHARYVAEMENLWRLSGDASAFGFYLQHAPAVIKLRALERVND